MVGESHQRIKAGKKHPMLIPGNESRQRIRLGTDPSIQPLPVKLAYGDTSERLDRNPLGRLTARIFSGSFFRPSFIVGRNDFGQRLIELEVFGYRTTAADQSECILGRIDARSEEPPKSCSHY